MLILSFLNACPYQRTLLDFASWPIVLFTSNICIRSLVDFLSINFTPHIFLTMALSVLYKIHISFWPRYLVSLLWSITDLTQLLYTIHLILRGNLFPQSKSWHSQNFTHPILVLDVTTASHPPPEFILRPWYENSVTVFTSSCNFSFWSSTFSWFPLHFLHFKSITYLYDFCTSSMFPISTRFTKYFIQHFFLP